VRTIAAGRDPFEALGNPHRRAIVALLADSPRSVQELADALPISRPAVSRHLRLLSDAGLVADQPLGARRLYRKQAMARGSGTKADPWQLKTPSGTSEYTMS
jgi:DNA-binding transcriptional ArsR family regulator